MAWARPTPRATEASMARTMERQERNAAQVERCIALSGKGSPDGATIEEALGAVRATAAALSATKRKAGHLFRPGEPEVRLRAPEPGQKGGARWMVLVRVPEFVSARDARAAAAAAAERRPAARGVRLVPVGAPALRGAGRPGRDRLPGTIRRTRSGPQHRAREALR